MDQPRVGNKKLEKNYSNQIFYTLELFYTSRTNP